MTRELIAFENHLPVPNWQWRDRFGTFHRPVTMETRHLFHTLRMIWNNHMPAHARVGNVRLYTFLPFYTKEYMGQAIMEIGRELARRDDLTKQWRTELEQMAAYFGNRIEGHRRQEQLT